MTPDREPYPVSQARCDLSVVIPVYNEEKNLLALHRRLEATLHDLGRSYEVIYVDDGSDDGSLEVLTRLRRHAPGNLRIVELYRNYGQFAAIAAGFERVRGAIVVTLDSDLQNPPEEIPKLVAKIDEGYDVANGWRRNRRDRLVRRLPSLLVNRIAAAATGQRVRDYGCMLRAYRREVVQQIVACQDRSPYIPTLANAFARRAAEVEVGHSGRSAGASKYPLARLVDLQYNMLATFPLLPFRVLSLSGLVICGAALVSGAVLGVRLTVSGAGDAWSKILLVVLFFLVGLLFLALGLVAELVGRTYDVVRRRPRFVVRREHGDAEGVDARSGTADTGEVSAPMLDVRDTVPHSSRPLD